MSATYRPGGFYQEGDSVTNYVKQALLRYVRAGDVIAITVAADYFVDYTSTNDYRYRNRLQYFAFLDLIYRNITNPRGAALVIFSDVPTQHAAAGWCKPTKFRSTGIKNCVVPKSESRSRFASFFEHMQNLTANPGIFFYDYHDLFCDGDDCSMFVPGTWIATSWDGSHLNEEGSHYLWPYFCSFFKSNGLWNYQAGAG